MTRKYTEREEGKCDYCQKDMYNEKKGSVERFKVKDKIVCRICYNRYRRRGTLARANRKKWNTAEERIENKRREERIKSRIRSEAKREKTEYLRSLSPEELIEMIKKKGDE